jgi:predicted permease
MGTLLQDLRFAARVLRKSPGFTVAAVLTLALAIGANAVVFSVMNALVLRPLNVPDPHSLYALWRQNDSDAHLSYPDYLDLRERNRSFEDLIAFNMDEAGADTGTGPSDVWVYETTGNYFDGLHLQPYLGRFFHAADEHGPDSAPYVVLSYGYWHSHFQEDRNVIGRVIQVDKHPFTIIGVAPAGFHGTMVFFNPDFFTPIVNQSAIGHNDLNKRSSRWLFMTLGHLKPGVTNAQAVADLSSVASYLAKAYPKEDGKLQLTLAHPGLYGDFLERPARTFMSGLMLLAILILLAACANLGSLFAARAADRSRELALRLALGSTRSRILRALFTEAMLISVIGGAVGLWGSVALLRALSVWEPMPRYPIYMPVNPDAHVYAVALLLTIVSGFLFGAVPVRQVLRASPYEVVKAGSIISVGRKLAVRDVLLVVQIALCAVLVTASFVAVRGMARTLHNNLGFEVDNVMLADTDLQMAGYSNEQAFPMQKRMIDALAAIPGVDAVGLSDGLPLAEGSSDSAVFRDDTPDLASANAVADANLYRISPEYFRAAGTTLLAGRSFTWHDDKNSPRVAVVNREFARRILGSPDHAIGRYFKMPDGTRIEVVGIAEDGKYSGFTEDPQPSMFLPIQQSPSSGVWLTVHSRLDPQQLAPIIRSRLREIDSGLPVSVQTRRKAMDIVLFGPTMATISLGVMGLMGAMLAITGVFGMAAYSVSKRLRELGIRIALGAQRREVLQAALSRPFKLLAFGSVAGLILGLLASRVLSYVVYQATPRDPLVLAGAVLTMLLLGLVATWIPARRALKVDPLVLLRVE